MDLAGVKVTRTEFFMELLRYGRMLLEVDWSNVDNMDKAECRCRLVDLHREEEDGAVELRRGI